MKYIKEFWLLNNNTDDISSNELYRRFLVCFSFFFRENDIVCQNVVDENEKKKKGLQNQIFFDYQKKEKSDILYPLWFRCFLKIIRFRFCLCCSVNWLVDVYFTFIHILTLFLFCLFFLAYKTVLLLIIKIRWVFVLILSCHSHQIIVYF